MKLSDITGVFSRYFVVGFFLPAYISLIALWLAASTAFVPNTLERHSQATQVAILGAVALVAGLAISGLSYYVMRMFEGYPLQGIAFWPAVGLAYQIAIRAQRRTYDKLITVRDDDTKPPTDRQRAAWLVERFFPQNRAALLPTRLGNAIRAFERHSNARWGLDGYTIWPRIDALLSSDERELHINAKIDLYVFINAAVGAFAVGICLIIDKTLNVPHPAWKWALYVIPFLVAYALYRAALEPAMRWGDAVRSSIDLHRLDLYEKLGVRAPTSFSDERQLASRLNRALLYGRPLLPDDLWRADQTGSQKAPDVGMHTLIDCLRKCLTKGE